MTPDGDFECIGMGTTIGDEVVHWVALRRVDDAGPRIDFRPESGLGTRVQWLALRTISVRA
ncbi:MULTISPECIES: hypothetical protein [Streptomyces]|uniref:Uncharacterized protein n=1 Tax=Streptomyces lienomycini TaxID=284035 RepID=A0ABV9WJ48_9ACTN|nr:MULTISPECIES: hypothetical protein [Streptomyces]